MYLHAGGFRTGDKSDDVKMLQWLCSLGYVTAGINYTLNSHENPAANVYTMSAAAAFFSYMCGKNITSDMFGTDNYDEGMRDVSALLCVNENTVPTVMAYGVYDTFQPYGASVKLDAALTQNNIPHKYIIFEHSGHGLQNDNKQMVEYSKAILEYLDCYLVGEDSHFYKWCVKQFCLSGSSFSD